MSQPPGVVVFSMTVSIDGFITDRDGGIDWSVPGPDLLRFHLDQVAALGGYLCGRRLYEAMLVWETDDSLRAEEESAAFADVWCALPKVVFSRTLRGVQGNARLAGPSMADEVAAALAAAEGRDVEIGGANLASTAIAQGLVGEFRLFRAPILLGGGARFFPPLPQAVPLELHETATFDNGVRFERWRPVNQQSPG